LTRDFKKISKDLDKRLTGELLEAVEPVRVRAEQMALTEITNMPKSPDWATMKTGVSRAKGTVWMAPAHRRSRGSSRPNLSNELLHKAMDPSITEGQDEVIDAVGDLIDTLADRYGFD
jgi:hypothetical protein